VSSAIASGEETNYLCKLMQGPRAGQIHDYSGRPAGPMPVVSPCQDGISSSGVTVAGKERRAEEAAGNCVHPSTEEDCDQCQSDRSHERCLTKVDADEQ
jgi:hypothetical protein